MEKFIFLFPAFLLFSINLFGQSFSDYWSEKDNGISIYHLKFDGFTETDTSIYSTSNPNNAPDVTDFGGDKSLILCATFGRNFPLITLADHLSIGLNPAIGFSLALEGGPAYIAEIPVFATLKYGTDATWSKSTSYEKKIGFGVGFGLQGTFGYTERFPEPVDFAYVLPTVMVEFSFVVHDSKLFKLRYYTNIGRSKDFDYSDRYHYPLTVSYAQSGVSFIVTRY